MVEDGVSRMEVVVAPGKKNYNETKNRKNILRPKQLVDMSFGPILVLTREI